VLVVEMDDEESYVPDDVLEEASVARHQMLPKKSKPVSERQWVKNDERSEVNEKETFTHW
jgi:hypothetical protein